MRRDEVIKRLRELRGMKAAVDQMEAALEMLEEEEREIIGRFYVNPEKYVADNLCELLMIEHSSVYRRRDKAIKKLEKLLG